MDGKRSDMAEIDSLILSDHVLILRKINAVSRAGLEPATTALKVPQQVSFSIAFADDFHEPFRRLIERLTRPSVQFPGVATWETALSKPCGQTFAGRL